MRASALAPSLLFAAVVLAAGIGHARPTKKAARRANPKKAWHTPRPDRAAPVDESGRPMLVLQGLNHPDSVALRARDDDGGFSAEDLDRAAHVLREASSGNEHPVDPRVLDLVYRVQRHFGAQEIRVISGYRTPRRGSRSNHGRGRAIDLVVPGASDEAVAKFARAQGFCGVGVYPVSGFVHLDVRERSYFWVDRSGPGKRSRTRGILSKLAAKSDAEALARGARPVPPFAFETDVEAALARAGVDPAGAPLFEDDDTEADGVPGDPPSAAP